MWQQKRKKQKIGRLENNEKILKSEIEKLYDLLNKVQEELNEKNNIIQKFNYKQKLSVDVEKEKIHNERGAGRKPTFAKDKIEQIKKDRKSKMTIKQLSEKYNCSVGKIHNIVNQK